MTRLDAALAAIGPLDERAMADARTHLGRLTKPAGSLGRLEQLAVQLAGITGTARPTLERRRIVVVAADHGIARRGVSAYPPEVTGQMVANFVAGGAAINVLAGWAGASLLVIDAGVATPVPVGDRPAPVRLVSASIGAVTHDMSRRPAMTREQAMRAIEVGLSAAEDAVREGCGVIGVGEMGIGNTTAASAITAVMTRSPVEAVTGRGTGLDDAGWARKVALIERAIAINGPDPGDPVGVLAAVGGFEIGVLVGLILGSAAARIPVVLDGFITGSAALVAQALCPLVPPRLVAGHRSPEPGHAICLARLGLAPLLDLDLRLGEGTGAALAIGLLDAAGRVRDEMATFESAGVAGPADGQAATPIGAA